MVTIPQIKLWQWYKGQLPPDGGSPLSLLMIQPTPFCNIACTYCYLPNRDSRAKFQLDLIEPLFKKLMDCGLLGDKLSILWHAGEPLVMPVDFYQAAFERTRAATAGRSHITHIIQTNAMLLSPAYCQLIKKFRVRVGVSIDGPEFIHDRHRLSRSGKGTFRRVMAGIELLRENRIPFDVIAVLTADSLDYPHEIYDFFRDLNIRGLGLNFDELEGANAHSSFALPEIEEKYASFMIALLGRMIEDNGRMRIRELTGAIEAINASLFDRPTIATQVNPFGILSVDVDGNLSTFSPELLDLPDANNNRYTIGSVSDIDFMKIFSEPRFVKMNNEIQAGVKACQETCGYFNVCGGGAPSNKLAENGRFDSTETLYCRFKKQIIIDVVEDFVASSLVRRRRHKRRPAAVGALNEHDLSKRLVDRPDSWLRTSEL